MKFLCWFYGVSVWALARSVLSFFVLRYRTFYCIFSRIVSRFLIVCAVTMRCAVLVVLTLKFWTSFWSGGTLLSWDFGVNWRICKRNWNRFWWQLRKRILRLSCLWQSCCFRFCCCVFWTFWEGGRVWAYFWWAIWRDRFDCWKVSFPFKWIWREWDGRVWVWGDDDWA